MQVLGIDVDPDLIEDWQQWLAPAVQPFFVDSADDWPTVASERTPCLTPEHRDTFKVWRMRDQADVVWLDEATFLGLARSDRARLVREQFDRRRGAVPSVVRWNRLLGGDVLRAQADGHRFVWWPSLVSIDPAAVLCAVVEADELPSRHREVPAGVWCRCESLLPGARSLAGTFPPSSGPNCFGTVLSAAGVAGASGDWVLRDRFSTWLADTCTPGGHDDDPGTVLVWRDAEHLPVHAAVTLGGGWAMEKPAQTWWAPRVVLDVRDLIRANRTPGQRLERHRLHRF